MMKMSKEMMPTAMTIQMITPIQMSGLNGHHQPGILSSLLLSLLVWARESKLRQACTLHILFQPF